MKKMVSYCVGCTSMGLYCKGAGCPNYKPVPEYSCDECGEDLDPSELYDYEGKMVCKDCLLGQLKSVEETESEE